jgi:hypothetical protein
VLCPDSWRERPRSTSTLRRRKVLMNQIYMLGTGEVTNCLNRLLYEMSYRYLVFLNVRDHVSHTCRRKVKV